MSDGNPALHIASALNSGGMPAIIPPDSGGVYPSTDVVIAWWAGSDDLPDLDPSWITVGCGYYWPPLDGFSGTLDNYLTVVMEALNRGGRAAVEYAGVGWDSDQGNILVTNADSGNITVTITAGWPV